MKKQDNSKQGIYMILNHSNFKMYIGSTKNLNRRKAEHFIKLRRKEHYNTYLQSSWDKYGADSFSYIVLEKGIATEDLFKVEKRHIIDKESLSSQKGYNMSLPNEDGSPGHLEITKEKLRRLAYIQYHGDIKEREYEEWKETLLKKKEPSISHLTQRIMSFDMITGEHIWTYNSIGEVARRYECSESIVSRLVNSNKEHFPTYKKLIFIKELHYDSMIEYKKYYRPLPTYKKIGRQHLCKPVELLDMKEDYIHTFSSALEASKFLCGTEKYVRKVITGEKPSYKGFKLRYKSILE